jgi:hypothetical protein
MVSINFQYSVVCIDGLTGPLFSSQSAAISIISDAVMSN